MSRQKQRSYDREFKVTICKMVLEDNIPIADIGKQYSINIQIIYRWVNEYKTYGDDAFVGSGKLRSEDARIKELERDLEEAKMEIEILKKQQNSFCKNKRKNRICSR